MKQNFICEMRSGDAAKIVYRVIYDDDEPLVHLLNKRANGDNVVLIGTLINTTKRGWTVRSFWLTGSPVNLFLPRGTFEMRADKPMHY